MINILNEITKKNRSKISQIRVSNLILGLTYEKFLETLLRIAIKKKKVFEDLNEDFQNLNFFKNDNLLNASVKEINFTEITVNKLLIDEYPELDKEDEIKEFGFIRHFLKYVTGENENDLKGLLLKRLENFKILMDEIPSKNSYSKFSNTYLDSSLKKGI